MLKLKRYIFQFEDGRYYRQSDSNNISSKAQVERWKDYAFPAEPKNAYYDALMKHVEDHKTTDINEAKVFKSKQAIRSSNAFTWGGKILEVKVNLELV